MKLFDDFEAVKFPEENLIYVTKHSCLYYSYSPEYEHWHNYEKAGYKSITVENYPDVIREELIKALDGKFPRKKTDFTRLCNLSELSIINLLELLEEDYPNYMANHTIKNTVHSFLGASNICFKSYLKLRELFDNAISLKQKKKQVLTQIKELCFAVIGIDIFKEEIYICDGHNTGSCFWIQPVRVIDFSDTNDLDNVAEMKNAEISIDEYDVYRYLTPFLYKYFDNELEANKKRIDNCWTDDDGNEECSYVSGFYWYLTHNFYTFESTATILNDIKNTMEALSSGRENEFTGKVKDEQTATELIIDFYRRFVYRMEYMMTIGKEKGYNLISFMGP